jgi:uncharacterized repeat protein (TIGR02543 family)
MNASKIIRLIPSICLVALAACGDSGDGSPKGTEFTLSYSASAGGSITGESAQTVVEGEDGSPVTAVADVGHAFEAWSDGVLAPTRAETNVRANLSVTAQFTPNQYTLSYLAGEGGGITGEATQTVAHGQSGSPVTATPDEGFRFNRWSDGLGTADRSDTNVTSDLTVTAEFVAADAELDQFTLTYLAGAGGTIDGVSPQIVDEGASGSAVLAVPDEGYAFVGWSDGSVENPRADSAVTDDLTVTANFGLVQLSLTYLAGPGGSISGSASQFVDYGESGAPVTAVPDVGYVFHRWSDGLGSASRTDENVTSDLTVTAEFVEDDVVIVQHTLTYAAGPGGSISGTSPQIVNEGSNGSAVTAVPEFGYHFVEWSDGSTQNPRTDTNVTEDVSVTASFAINVYTLTYDAAYGGELFGDVVQMVTHGGSGTYVNAVATVDGYHFTGWSDGVTLADRQDANVVADLHATAGFARYEYTLTYQATLGGSIEGVLEQVVPHGESGTPVTAIPDAGYVFVKWSDDVTTATRVEVDVTQSRSFFAEFEAIPGQFTLSYSAGEGGSILGDAEQLVEERTNGTAVTAVPDIGYEFVQWSDGSSQNPRTDTDVQADIAVEATFQRMQYWVTYTRSDLEAGYITPGTAFLVYHGDDVPMVTAVANDGFAFVQWSDGLTSPTRQDLEVTGPLTFEAQFVTNPIRTLTYVAGPGGSIAGELVQAGPTGMLGTEVTAMPDEGHQFTGWSDGVTMEWRTDAFPAEDATLTAEFELLQYNVFVGPSTAGVSLSPTGNLSVDHGTALEITATPSVGYRLDSITGCGGTQDGFTFTTAPITANCAVYAEASDVATPHSLVATPGIQSVTLSWSELPQSDAESFNVYYATEPGFDATNYQTKADGTKITGVISPHVISGLDADVTYHFVVTAIVPLGESAPSNEASATPTGPVSVRPPLNDTGIVFCGAATSGNASPCLGTEPEGQDAHHGRDLPIEAAANLRVGSGHAGFRFSKVSNGGAGLSEDAQLGASVDEWGCTRDNVTGLVWEVKRDDAGDLRHHGHRYTWYDTNSPDGNPGALGTTLSCVDTLGGAACNTENYVFAVNAAGLCGHSDWRLPTAEELESVVDYSREAPAIDTYFFPHAPGTQTWTRNPSASSTDNAWFVHFEFGRVNDASTRGAAHAVRLVRGPAPMDEALTRYEPMGVNGEIVRDLVTGLEWQRCSVGQTWNASTHRCDGTAATFNRADAAAQTADGGFRAPTLHELKTLVYCSSSPAHLRIGKTDNDACPAASVSPTIFDPAFPDTPSSMYWTNTNHPDLSVFWRVWFENGSVAGSDVTNLFPVRLVRPVAP